MAVNLAPMFQEPWVDASGDPLTGYQLFTYTAGSSTKEATYTASDGLTAQANPIILNSSGYPANPIWLTAGVSYKFVLATAADTDPPTGTVITRDNIDGINDTTVTADQWITGPAPTYVSATKFTLVGDQTSTFTVGRKVKTTNTAGSIYSTISVSAFTTLTTITVVNESGTLDSGLSAVSYGILTSTNSTVPGVVNSGLKWTHLGDIVMSSAMDTWAKGADVASATALPLITDGNYFDVTGTVTVTSFNTVGVGTLVKLHFDGALILTHDATNLIMPNSANYTTAAGDEFEFIEYATGDYRCTGYSLATGKSIVETTSGGNVIVPHEGLIAKYVTAATADIDADAIVLRNTGRDAYVATSVNLTVDISTGTGINTLDTGSEASDTWYYLWVIYNGTTVASLISASNTIGAITLPAGYTYAGLVGAVYNESGSDFVNFNQQGTNVTSIATNVLTSGSATTVTSVDLSAAVPPIAKGLTAQMLGDTSIATGTSSSFLYSDSGGVMLIGFERFHSVTANNSQGTMVTNGVISVASTVYYKVSAGTDDLAINVYGWGY